jgi:outer membrane lipoprotein SlyB
MKRFLAVAATLGVAVVVLAGCTATNTPIVDTKGTDPAQRAQDDTECHQYADNANIAGDAAVGALGGAAGGAALGAITGALVPGVSAGGGAALGAASGGVLGLGAGAYSGVEQRNEIYRNCMKNRGYSVLN